MSDNNSDKSDNVAPAIDSTMNDNDGTKPTGLNVRYTTWGIFTIAYEPAFLPSLPELREPLRVFRRVAGDCWSVSPWMSLRFYMVSFWLAIAPALSLACVWIIAVVTGRLFIDSDGSAVEEPLFAVKCATSVWLLVGWISYLAERHMVEFRAEFGPAIRAHFLPRLAETRLQINIGDLTENDTSCFPHPWQYSEYVPIWEFFERTVNRFRHFGVIFFEIGAMIYLASLIPGHIDSKVLLPLTAACITLNILCPPHIGGHRGYTFWTHNAEYNRLLALFNIIFDDDFCRAVRKDGLTTWFIDEFKKVSETLTSAKSDTWLIFWGIPAPWYWGLPDFLVEHFPVAVYAMWIPFGSTNGATIITTIIIFQFAMTEFKTSLPMFQGKRDGRSLATYAKEAKNIYDVLDKQAKAKKSALLDYPPDNSSKGSHISLNNLSFSYEGPTCSDKFNMTNIQLIIQPGKLIVITGANGSGKTTLVKLLCGLLQPTNGEIEVDHHKIQEYDLMQYLQAIAYIGQSEEIYPAFTLRENILFGLGNQVRPIAPEDLDEVVSAACATDLIERHGYEAVLQSQGIISATAAVPSKDVYKALEFHSPVKRRINISSGQKQRLIAARALMRAKHGNARCIILDEATNAVDSIAERNIFETFRGVAKENGQTMIIVTHKLSVIAQHADVILCMDKGRIIEQGTHDELLTKDGQYAALYTGSN